MAQRKQRKKRVENRYIVLTATKGKEDVKGKKRLSEARKGLESAGFRIVGVDHLPSGRNILLSAERPIRN